MHQINTCNILKIRILIVIISIVTSLSSFGQVFDASQNPPALKWRQIDTQNFQLIYPETFEKEAQRVAATLSLILEKVAEGYRKPPRKISIVLQNQGTTANGFVQLAPRRSEFFTTPSQEFDYQDWLNSLAIHEMRHVVQFDILTGGLSAPWESLALAIFGITLPPWFYEGDAVITETALTAAGRGRQPEFDLVMRTNALSGRQYSYSKNYLGSLKNFTPGYYPLGFFMTSKIMRDEGPGIVDSIVDRIRKNPLRPYAFSSAVKKFTGLNTAQLHDRTLAEVTDLWRKNEPPTAPSVSLLNTRKDNEPINYYMPAALLSGKVAVLRRGLGRVPAIVVIDSAGRETTLQKVGIQEDAYFRYAAGKFVWDEFRFDPRYHKRSWNVILLRDEATGKTRQITHKSRLFAPNLSLTGDKIIAVEVDAGNRVALVELDLSGREIHRFNAPPGLMLQTPAYDFPAEKVVVTAVGTRGKTLLELNLADGKFSRLFEFQPQLLSKPAYTRDGRIVYKAHYTGTDDIYVFQKGVQAPQNVSNARFGAYNPSVDAAKNRILYSTYTADGYAIAAVALPPTTVGDARTSAPANYLDPVIAAAGTTNVFDSIPVRTSTSTHYREFSNLLYVHSIVPILEQDDIYDDLNLGFRLQSDNKLNTLSTYVGYQFNHALRKNEYLAGFTYARYFPVVNVNYENRARFFNQRLPSGTGPAATVRIQPVNWREHLLEAKLRIPLTMNGRNYTYSITAEAGTGYTSRYRVSPGTFPLARTIRFPMVYRLGAGRYALRSARDITYRWGQDFSVTYRNLPFARNLTGDLLVFRSNFWFPGLGINHSLQVSVNAQRVSGAFSGTEDIPTVAGYSSLPFAGVLKNTVLTDYRFPIAYPDWEIGPLAYIKRIRGAVFADFENSLSGNGLSPRTYGAELAADMNLLRFYLPDFSVRARFMLTNSSRVPSLFEAGFSYTY